VVISTDLSHYLPYQASREVDAGTAALINALEPAFEETR
jgi:AmmeMemoRadiSam system protein B